MSDLSPNYQSAQFPEPRPFQVAAHQALREVPSQLVGRLAVQQFQGLRRMRRLLAQGLSIHQAIEDQYYTTIPWEGHHREYTAAEIDWILRQAGCRDVRTRLFDYNLLQFNQLSSEHLTALLRMTIDPARADMVLAAGRLAMPARERPPT